MTIEEPSLPTTNVDAEIGTPNDSGIDPPSTGMTSVVDDPTVSPMKGPRAPAMLLVPAALATLFGASLGFAVQPLISRQVLPRLGGGAAVWNTTLVFFQAMLLLGYLLTHLTSTYLTPAKQAAVHLGLLAAGLIVLPIGVPDDWAPPTSANPSWWLLVTLARTVGLPYLAVATTSPLVQRWFSTGLGQQSDPYWLYAVSNVGSFVGLLAVPLILDRTMSLTNQAQFWAVGYGLYLVACVGVFVASRRVSARTLVPSITMPSVGSDSAPTDIDSHSPQPTLRRWLLWTLLAALPSSLILGVTAHLTTDVASVPLLWVIPLGLYLITHVIAFARRTVPIAVWDVCAAISVGAAIASLIGEVGEMPWKLMPHLAALFFVSLACHARLASQRPAAQHLTLFYLAMAVGGVAGGAFNALVAPLVFKQVVEYPAALAISLLIIGYASHTRKFLAISAAGAIAAGVAAKVAGDWLTDQPVRLMVVAAAVLAVAIAWRQGLVAVAIAGTLAVLGLEITDNVIRAERSFYGAMRIETDGTLRTFVHGTTTHGYQFIDQQKQQTPTSYYGPTGPLGELIKALQNNPQRSVQRPEITSGSIGRIGAIGLGVGTIASYTQPDDQLTYFEIDPTVVEFAQDSSLFTYLSGAKGAVDVVVGDGRRTLAESDTKFDLLVLDAFSSDSIPIHLLTKEAFEMYRTKLAPGGVMAVHISNRYLDLEPVVTAIASDLGLIGIGGHHQASEEEETAGTTGSDWLVLTEPTNTLPELTSPLWSPLRSEPNVRMWTDDRADLLDVLL
jgi:hypothetical protein